MQTRSRGRPPSVLEGHRGSPRRGTSAALAEVVVARIWDGIHFRFADVEARKQGRHVAQWASSHFLRPLDDDQGEDDDEQ